MVKAIIVETNAHGEGILYNPFTEETVSYAYDDGSLGDIYSSVKGLIRLGILDPADFLLFDDISELLQTFAEALD